VLVAHLPDAPCHVIAAGSVALRVRARDSQSSLVCQWVTDLPTCRPDGVLNITSDPVLLSRVIALARSKRTRVLTIDRGLWDTPLSPLYQTPTVGPLYPTTAASGSLVVPSRRWCVATR
jgi:hypothetical protein